ncbi:MAG: hypothetical protein ACKVIY_03575 [Acidimicrobiales bacterium]
MDHGSHKYRSVGTGHGGGGIFEFDISGASIVAFAAALWGTLTLEEGRHRQAIVWFTAAVLAREVMLLYLAGVCIYRLWQTRRIPRLVGSVPALSAVAWTGYVRLRLDSHDGVTGLIIVMPLLILRTWQRPNALAFGAIGFILIAIMMTQQVWWRFFDISRAVVPILTAYVITAFSPGPPNTKSFNEPPRAPQDDAAP